MSLPRHDLVGLPTHEIAFSRRNNKHARTRRRCPDSNGQVARRPASPNCLEPPEAGSIPQSLAGITGAASRVYVQVTGQARNLKQPQ